MPVLPPPTGTGTPVPRRCRCKLLRWRARPGCTRADRSGRIATPVPVVPGPAGARITVTLDNIPLGEALRYVANQAGLKVKVEPYAVSVIPLTEQSNDLITKRYHVPPEFFGGPLDVGYYIGSQCGRWRRRPAAPDTEFTKPPPVSDEGDREGGSKFSDRRPESEPARVPRAQTNQVQGTATTRQTLLNDRQLVGRADAKTMLQSMGVSFPSGRKRNVLAAQRHADRSQHAGQFGHGRCVGRSGECFSAEAGLDRIEVCRDQPKQSQGTWFRLVARPV